MTAVRPTKPQSYGQNPNPYTPTSVTPNGVGWRPDPDPTVRTEEQSRERVDHLKELVLVRVDAVEEAAKTANENLVRVPTEVQKQVAGLKELVEEKIAALGRLTDERFLAARIDAEQRGKAVADLFTERDKGVQVALLAAEKAVGKQTEASDRAAQKAEDASKESLKALEAVVKSDFAGVRQELSGQRELISTLRNDLSALIAGGVGSKEQRLESRGDQTIQHSGSALSAQYIMLGLTLLSVGAVLVDLIARHP